jgi:hypothetical protein
VHASCMRYQWHRMHYACGVIDTACIFNCCFAHDFHFSKLFEKLFVHVVSMIPHALCMRSQWHRMHFKKFEYLREFEFIFENALAP